MPRAVHIPQRNGGNRPSVSGGWFREVAAGREGAVLVCIPLELYMEKKLRAEAGRCCRRQWENSALYIRGEQGEGRHIYRRQLRQYNRSGKRNGNNDRKPSMDRTFRQRGVKMYGAHGLNVLIVRA